MTSDSFSKVKVILGARLLLHNANKFVGIYNNRYHKNAIINNGLLSLLGF